jgi:hypothetical protein
VRGRPQPAVRRITLVLLVAVLGNFERRQRKWRPGHSATTQALEQYMPADQIKLSFDEGLSRVQA